MKKLLALLAAVVLTTTLALAGCAKTDTTDETVVTDATMMAEEAVLDAESTETEATTEEATEEAATEEAAAE
jgi:outer membrane murein-binding lipoprotein Lpp